MRKLANVCIAFAGAVFLAHYGIGGNLILPAAALAAVLGLRLRRAGIRRGVNLPLACLGAALGFCCCFVQNETTVKQADALSGRELTVNAVVQDFPTTGGGYTSVYIRLRQEGVPGVTARLYDYDGYLPALRPGDELTVTVRFKSARVRYGEETDYYTARNVFAVCTAAGEGAVTGSRRALYLPQYAAQAVRTAVAGAFPADTAPFLKALLMGDKTDYYAQGDLYVVMRASGLAHVVAVSGLHVAFLIGFLQLILGRTRRSSLLCLALVWFFVVMTGAGPSTVRAGFMQSMLLLAPLFGRENDGLTSLSFPLAVILLLNPAAAGSAALQMSFGAMAGILLLSPRIFERLAPEERRKKLPRPLRYGAGVLASSLGASAFTVPLLALRFGYVPLLGPLTNLLCLWAVTLCFCGGFLACALWVVWAPLGHAMGWCVSWLARYIAAAAGLVAKIPYADVYTSNQMAAWWLLLTYAVFAAAWLWRKKDVKFRWAVPAAISAFALAVALVVTAGVYADGAGYFTALDVGQGQSLAVMAARSTVVVDCGGSGTDGNAGERMAAYLLGCGRRRVDALVLTHLHADHANGVVRLMQMMPVAELILPRDASDDDGLLPEILTQAAESGVAVRYIDADTDLAEGVMRVALYAPVGAGTENERGLSMTVSVGDYGMLVTGDMNRTAEKALLAGHDLSGTELLIAGHHGSKNSTGSELLAETGAQTAIISVGYNTYGHPTNAALARLYDAGAAIYRTDLNGNVTVRTN
ncbi:MAG TPA: DNA internalization-related competence protein ComEC/Rec2 [Oscillospiraceae bacterium]|nr:DNA internalization-related competence protein ComEC/Rec2 [Oscillospiraceae bacterium]